MNDAAGHRRRAPKLPVPVRLALVALSACGTGPAPDAPRTDADSSVPETRRDESVVDDYHGVEVADPYRWLEDQDSSDVRAWTDRQNARTESYLARSPFRGAIRRRLEALWNYARYSPPERHGETWLWFRNDGLQDQSVLYRAASPRDDGIVVLDPNRLSDDGTIALGQISASDDGSRLAYSIAASGSDWQEWRVLDIRSGQQLADHLRWTKFTRAEWSPDGEGFYYQRYPAPGQGEVFEATNRQPRLCYHRVGTAQDDDEVVYERPDQPDWSFAAKVTDDGRYLVVDIGVGTDRRNRIAYLSLDDRAAGVRPLLFDFDAAYHFVGNDAATWWFWTDHGAPNGRIVAVDLADPRPEAWTEVVSESKDRLESVHLIADQLVLVYLHDARHVVRRAALDGTSLGTIDLPDVGSVQGFTGERADRVTYFSFSGFTRPATIFAFDFDRGELTELREPVLGFDAAAFVTRQVALESEDGTRLAMFLVHRKDLRLDGTNPTYLYGYGGFGISLTPTFSVPPLVWVERGGVYAQATLRGGGEYGEAWHRDGMLERKQNVFDDFVACARYLVRNDYTRPERLAIGGGSNGGLLVGACLTQHPELFGAAIPQVGVLDMLRYHRFTIGWAWASEFGRSDDPGMFPVLFAYSPLHNIRDGAKYPATMIMTGDHDDRVLPGHSYKFAAALQRAQGGDGPILLRVSRKAGHGAGTPVRKRIEDATDMWSFLSLALAGQ